MKKFFQLIAGTKFYCDEKGILSKDAEGNFKEVPADDTEAQEVEVADDAVADIEKMISKATDSVKAKSQSELDAATIKATEAVTKMFDGITKGAEKHTNIAQDGAVKSSFDVDEVLKGLNDLHGKQRNSFSFSVKNLADLSFLAKSTSEGESLTGDVIEPQRQPGLERAPVRRTFIEDISNVTPNMTSDSLSYVEAVTESGAPLTTAELVALPEKDFTFQEFKAPLVKIGVTNKHSVELLKDAPQLVNAIKGWLQEDVNIETDEQLLNGAGTTGKLTGIFTAASELDATAVGTKRVANANLFDVIRLAMTKIAVGGKGKFQATSILLNPEDADELDLTKDADGRYILPPFISADGTKIKGATIIENTGVTAGDFLVGDFRKNNIGTKGGVDITMTNSDGTDFGKDILTVKLTRRVAAYVRSNDNGAFFTGTIATVIAALLAS